MGCGTALFIYANNEPKSALARDLGDCRDNKGKLAKRVFTCYHTAGSRPITSIPANTRSPFFMIKFKITIPAAA